jgi:hypothetical protein
MRALLWAAVAALVLVGVARTSDADARRGRSPVAPQLLSQTGLYVAGTTTVEVRNRPFSPQYPLWTDGAAKRRWIRLPEGAAIDARDDARWGFPVGTKFWKEFQFGGRRVETRFMWKAREDAWVFASYVWNGDQTDAVLAPVSGERNVAEVGPGARHSVPSIDDCYACHEGQSVLGFTALQLSTDRDPLAPHREPLEPDMLTVRSLVDEQRLKPARPDLVAQPPRIQAATPEARAALGYLATNCGICHREGAAIDTHLRLQPTAGGDVRGVLEAVRSAPVEWAIPSAGERATRFVTPGHPELSSIVARMKSRRPSTQMPPLGTVVVDQQAVDLVTAWIMESPKVEVRSSK